MKINENKVLDTWILTEILNEGLIDINRKENDKFFYHSARDYAEFRTLVNQIANKKGTNKDLTVNVYFDIVDPKLILQKISDNSLSEKDAEIPDNVKNFKLKISFQFNKNKDLVFSEQVYLSASGQLYYQTNYDKSDNSNLRQKENELIRRISSSFENPNFSSTFDGIVKEYAGNYDNLLFSVENRYEEDSFMHSSFIEDLKWAKQKIDNQQLKKYILGFSENDSFINFNDQKNIKQYTQPKNYPLGRFASNPSYSLSLMQQVTVNVTSNLLDTESLQGVNGPPGTGKTTLLKEIFADYIVKQAKLIIDLTSGATIRGQEIDNSRKKLDFLNKKISNLEILVASSNNGAVQNIVSELPDISSIHKDFIPSLLNIDYFNFQNDKESTDVSSRWGEFSREGGKKSNLTELYGAIDQIVNDLNSNQQALDEDVNSKFSNLYNKLSKQRNKLQADWENKEALLEKKSKKLLELEENEQKKQEKKILENKIYFEVQDAQRDFNENILNLNNFYKMISKFSFFNFLLPKSYRELYQRLNDLNKQYSKLVNEGKNIGLKVTALESSLNSIDDDLNYLYQSSFELKELDNKLFEQNKNNNDLQMGNPFFNLEFRREQTELFILALAVRKQFLFENRSNLKTANDIFKNKYEFRNSPELLSEAWHWINFAIPVISSTFASFGQMFKYFEESTLGNLFIDEAGQAIPQAAVGSIIRSKKVLAVGDPKQITPVQTLDQTILNCLAKINDIPTFYVKKELSLQNLIDDASHFGFADDNEKIGIPLVVHRRCSSPMFEISNKLSYNGRMVQGKPNSQGKAAWINVKGKAKDKFVKEQEQTVIELLDELVKKEKISGEDIYIISPFKNISSKLKRNKLITDMISPQSIGTVHTFQGKENKIVIFVLGADSESVGSAQWAFNPANLANVAVTRAKDQLYVIGDKSIYSDINNAKILIDLIDDYNSGS